MQTRFLYLDLPMEKQTLECYQAMYDIFPDKTSIKWLKPMLLVTFPNKESLARMEIFIAKLETSLQLDVESLCMTSRTQSCTVILR